MEDFGDGSHEQKRVKLKLVRFVVEKKIKELESYKYNIIDI